MAPPAAHASNFTVTPTEVNLVVGNERAGTLRNGSKTALRFEITCSCGPKTQKGKMTLEPWPTWRSSRSSSWSLRPATSASASMPASRAIEQSFRIFIESRPDQSAPVANTVAIRKSRYSGILRLMKPVRSAPTKAFLDAGKGMTRVKNTGNLHINVDNVIVKGAGASPFSKEGLGHALPGATRI